MGCGVINNSVKVFRLEEKERVIKVLSTISSLVHSENKELSISDLTIFQLLVIGALHNPMKVNKINEFMSKIKVSKELFGKLLCVSVHVISEGLSIDDQFILISNSSYLLSIVYNIHGGFIKDTISCVENEELFNILNPSISHSKRVTM